MGAIITGGAVGAAAGATEGAAAGAGEGAAAGGTFGEAGTSFAGDELATGAASGAAGDIGAGAAVGGTFGEAGTSAAGDELATGAASGAPGDVGAGAAAGGTFGEAGTSAAGDQSATSAAPDLSGFTGTAGGPFNSMSGTAFTPDAAPASATGTSTGTDPVATLQSTNFDTLSPDSLNELNSANPAATATQQNAATSALGNSSTQAPQGVFDNMKIPSWASTLAKWTPAATGAAGLVKQLTQGKSSAEKQIEQSAANATSVGNQLLAQGQAGTLSPGMQANVDQIKEQMKAQVRGQFANMGLSGSTMEADALNSVDTKISGIVQQYSQNLIQTGQQILQTGTTEFQSIAEAELAADQALQQAIGNFAGTAGISMGLNSNKKAA
jgi:hypothetical protein